MRSSDWQPMETAPLNPYGHAWGPTILIYCASDNLPWPAFYAPQGAARDNGPRWVIQNDDAKDEIWPEDALAWMPIASPWAVKDAP